MKWAVAFAQVVGVFFWMFEAGSLVVQIAGELGLMVNPEWMHRSAGAMLSGLMVWTLLLGTLHKARGHLN